MATYCDQTDIEENLKAVTFSATTAVTATALTNMIARKSAFIDSMIQVKYILPISDATALLYLKDICIDLVVFDVTKVLQAKNALPAPDLKVTQEISVGFCYKQALKMLEKLANGSVALPSEDIKSVSNMRSTAVDDDAKYNFKLEEQQW